MSRFSVSETRLSERVPRSGAAEAATTCRPTPATVPHHRTAHSSPALLLMRLAGECSQHERDGTADYLARPIRDCKPTQSSFAWV